MNTTSQAMAAAERAGVLLRETQQFAGLEGAARLQQELAAAIRLAHAQESERPVLVALMGGTGAGKSEMFNALTRLPGASPVSGAERAFTRQPFLAVHPSEAALIALPEEAQAVVLDRGMLGVAIADTPDIDSAFEEHRERARAVLRAADIVVYVALPEKRSNFVIAEEIKAWADRKSWFFALNKVDLCAPEDLGAIREDFARRIEELGFQSSDSVLFLVSATEPHHPYSEFERLRSAVYSARTRAEVRRFHEAGVYRALVHATRDEVTAPLSRVCDGLAASEQVLAAAAAEVYLRVLSSAAVRETLTDLIREQVWRRVPGRVGGFLALPLWVASRFRQLWLTVSMARVAAGGFSPAALLQAAWTAMVSYVRGVLPMQALVSAFNPGDLQRLRELRMDAVRKCEDAGLLWEEPQEAAQPGKPPEETGTGAETMGDWFRKDLAPEKGDARQAQLAAVLWDWVQKNAAMASARAVGRAHQFFGNLLPLAVFIDVSRKAIGYWIENRWLPGDFYLLAIFLFILSTVPGCFLIGAAVKARARAGESDDLIHLLDEPAETLPLRRARDGVERLVKRVGNLRRQAIELDSAASEGLASHKFGIGQSRTR